MKIKSYFANSVDAAIRQAHNELGPEAILIESRAPSPDKRHLGRFEVVLGLAESGREEMKAKESAAAAGRDDLAAELKMLRGQITDLRRMLQPAPAPVDVDKTLQELIAADIDPAIAETLVEAAELVWQAALAPSSGGAPKSLQQIVLENLRSRMQTAHDVNASAPRGNVTVFVGPPGVGKTTALAKVAVHHCLGKRRSVRMISIDTDRVGGHELLRAYSNVLGIGFIAANSLHDFQDALVHSQEKMCVLIDTPGFGPADMGSARDLAAVLDSVTGCQVHLVLPASMKRADATEYTNQFAIFKPSRLLFTKFDETASVGSVLSETIRLALPLSFFSMGQGVPEDLENADPEVLIGRLFPATAAPAASAA